MSGPGSDPVRLRADMVHPSHLEALLPALGPAVVLRLRGCSRLSERLASRIGSISALPSAAEATEAERLALRSPERIEEAGRLMGAAWHGRALQGCIDAGIVAELDARIGRAARLFGLRAGLASADTPVAAPGALAAAVTTDGLACLAAWRKALRHPFRQLASLKLPRHGLPPAAPAGQADPIIARVLQEVADEPRP